MEMWSCDQVKFSNIRSIGFLNENIKQYFLNYFLSFNLKSKQTFGIFVQTSRGYLLKLLGAHSHSKAVSQGENILQLIKILFVWDAETKVQTLTQHNCSLTAVFEGGDGSFLTAVLKGVERSFTPFTASVLAWSFLPSQLMHYIWKCGCAVYYQAYSSLLSAYSPFAECFQEF